MTTRDATAGGLSLVLRCELASCAVAHEALQQLLAPHQPSARASFGLDVVLEELLMNQILQTRLKGHEQHGVESTPTFLVNGDKYTGAMKLSEWDGILAKYLN